MVTEDWYFLSHRSELAAYLQAEGWEIEVACSAGSADSAEKFRTGGFHLLPTPFHRESLSPMRVAQTLAGLRRLIRQRKPAAVLPVALRPAVMAPWACPAGMPVVNFLAGMGSLATGEVRRVSAAAASRLVNLGLKLALRRRNSRTLVQNSEDLETCRSLAGDACARVEKVSGTGLDPASWQPRPEPPDLPFRMVYAGRLLADKGVRELVQAHTILRREDPAWELEILGDRDPANPASLSADELQAIASLPGVRLAGKVSNVLERISAAHLFVFPSYREGLPRAILEAGLCARAVITTNVAGCREAVRDGESGILVPPRQSETLAAAARTLRQQREVRRKLGEALRRDVETTHAIGEVGPRIGEILRRAVAR